MIAGSMAVYVDNSRNKNGTVFTSHMIADTHEELLEMGRRLGLRPVWLQFPNEWKEHFDVSQLIRNKAVDFGAIEIDKREFIVLLIARREGAHASSSN